MNLNMTHELFPTCHLNTPCAVQNTPPNLYPQEIDWSCAFACLRSITSGIIALPADSQIITGLRLLPGPVYSDTIKAAGLLDRPELNARYGCDEAIDVQALYDMLRDGWRLMVNWMYSYDHWTVLTEYIPETSDPDHHMMTHWDPYCGELFRIRQGHFSAMWLSGGNETHQKDFIAVRQK